MNIRLMNTDKPTGVVGFLPMEGGDEGGSGKEVARLGVPVVAQVEEPGTGVQEELADIDDLGSDVEILEAPQANPAHNMIQSLDVKDFEPSFPKPFSTGDSSDSDDTYMNEEEEDEENANVARDIQKSLQERYDAAEAIDDSYGKLKSDAFFSIATNFSIAKNDLNYLNNMQQGKFLPLEAAKSMTIGSTIYDSRKQALAFYMIAINPAVPIRFRYEAVIAIGDCDDYDHPYQNEKMDAFQEIAEDARAETKYRVWALRELKNDGIADHRLAPITASIAERWACQGNTDENWRLFEDLYRLEADETEWIPDEYRQEESTPTINEIQLSIIEIIINNTNLNKDFRIRVINEKLQGHHQQAQSLDNISGGEKIELSLTIDQIKSARNL